MAEYCPGTENPAEGSTTESVKGEKAPAQPVTGQRGSPPTPTPGQQQEQLRRRVKTARGRDGRREAKPRSPRRGPGRRRDRPRSRKLALTGNG